MTVLKKIKDMLIHKVFGKGITEKLNFPLVAIPANKSNMVSPRVGNANGCRPFNKEGIADALAEVLDVRCLVNKNIYPYEFLAKHYPTKWGKLPMDLPEPLLMKGLSTDDVAGLANVVEMDDSLDLGLAIKSWLFTQSPKVKDLTVLERAHVEFLKSKPALNVALANANCDALEAGFAAKYFYGIIRPEEYYEEIFGTKGERITAYENGAPSHPSFPAGHSCVAGATGRTFQEFFNLTPQQNNVIRQTCYLWGMFRTLAGVHYAEDNIAGLIDIGGIK